MLSIFYPMWNEEEYIERAIAYGRRSCERMITSGEIADYELIIINDASTDATAAIADRLAEEDSRSCCPSPDESETRRLNAVRICCCTR